MKRKGNTLCTLDKFFVFPNNKFRSLAPSLNLVSLSISLSRFLFLLMCVYMCFFLSLHVHLLSFFDVCMSKMRIKMPNVPANRCLLSILFPLKWQNMPVYLETLIRPNVQCLNFKNLFSSQQHFEKQQLNAQVLI